MSLVSKNQEFKELHTIKSNQKVESVEENAVTYGNCGQADTCLLCHADKRWGLCIRKRWSVTSRDRKVYLQAA